MIDVNFSITEDKAINFWDDFWFEEYPLQGASKIDPDGASKILQSYHKIVWGGRKLPSGAVFGLEAVEDSCELIWGGKIFSSDWFFNTYLHWYRCRHVFPSVKEIWGESYKEKIKAFVLKTYTIGGMMIFPVTENFDGVNCARGCKIGDRADLTIECIRRFYEDKEANNPIFEDLDREREYFNQFKNFDGFIKFFFLDPFIEDSKVKILFGAEDILDNKAPDSCYYPYTAEEWLLYIENATKLIDKRNDLIKKSLEERKIG